MITEYLMKPGQWELSLVRETPLSVRQGVPYPFGTLVITLNRLATAQTLTRAAVLGQAIYSGIIRRRSNQMRTFGGPSILAWLGTEGGNGPEITGGSAGLSAVSWQTAVHAEFTGGHMSGITEGSYYSTNGTTINAIPGTSRTWPSWRKFYDPVAAQVGVEYRLRPDGVLDSAGVGIGDRSAATGIYQNTPAVCLLRDQGGREATIVGLRTTVLEVTSDYDSYTNSVYLYGTGVSGIWGSTSVWYDFAGTAHAVIAHADDYSTTNATDAQNAAEAFEENYVTEHREVRISVHEYGVQRFMVPGDYVYVFDPETGMVDNANPVYFRGSTTYPEKVRLLGYTWPVEQGMGVYAISSDNTNTVTDLTDWIDWETGYDTTLEVDALPRPLAPAMQAGPGAA